MDNTSEMSLFLVKELISDIMECEPFENGETVLHLVIRHIKATESRIIEILQSYSNLKKDINVENSRGETVLHLAIGNQQRDVIDFFIKSEADMNWRGKNGNSLAHYSIESGYNNIRIASSIRSIAERRTHVENVTDFTKWFLRKELDLLCKNNDKISPLVLAVKLGFYQILPFLLERDNDVSYIDKSNKNLFHLFFEMDMYPKKFTLRPGQTAEVELLPSNSSFYLKSAITTLLDKGVSVDAVDNKGNTPLHLAAKHPDKWSEVIDLVLNHFTNVNAKNSKGNTVLQMITKNCTYDDESVSAPYTEFVRTLTAKGAEINIKDAEGITPLSYAVSHKHLPIFQILKGYGADYGITSDSGNLLHLFGKSQVPSSPHFSNEIIKCLIEEGCDVNAKNKNGMTPLHFACQSSDCAAVQSLLDHGADVHARELSEHSYTPLHEAADYDRQDIIELLVKAGADVNALDGFRHTPLHIALKNWYEVEGLLKLGAQVDVYDGEGILPMHQAINKTKRSNILALLEFGASINDPGSIEGICCANYQKIVLDVILEHWFKMKWVGLPATKEYVQFVGSWKDFDKKYEDCTEEIKILKECLMDGQLSCYNFLHMNLNKRCKYVQNEKVREFMKSETFIQTFPNYSILILAAYHQSITRKSLEEPAVNAWYSATNVRLPLECVGMIECYLENLDLVALINGGKRYSQEVIVID